MWLSRKSLSKLFGYSKVAVLGIMALGLVISCSPGSNAGASTDPNQSGSEEQATMRIMPAAGQAAGWVREGESKSFRGESLFEHINGGADIYHEYGFVTLVTQIYGKGEKTISLEVYCMDDPAAAFGIYTYNRHPTLSPTDVGSDGTIHANGLFFWQDRYFVDIRQLGSGTIHGDEFVTFAKIIEGNIGMKKEAPGIVALLPAENMVPRSVVYAVGNLGINNQVYVADDDLFGLKKGEAAAIARYKISQPEFSIIIAQYATEDNCRNAFVRFREHFLGAESKRESEFVAEAMPAKHMAVRRVGNRLFVVANAHSQKTGMEMLDTASAE